MVAKQVGLVLLAHGSRGDKANDGMYEVAQALRDGGEYTIVEVGFMQRNFPTIEEAAKACVTQGAQTVLLIPYFLHAGLHMQQDLPETVHLLKELHPGVRFALGKPFAHHPRLLDIVQDRITECLGSIGNGGADKADADEEDSEAPHPERALRTGYTTGACAAAAAKAAAQVLLSQKRVIEVEIPLPIGQRVRFKVGRCEIRPDYARCSVIKDAGDDPDVTNHAEICAAVSWNGSAGVLVTGGEGVGVVTKPGLELPVGEPAINPVPRKMIEVAVAEGLGPSPTRGVKVEITVPAGQAFARRTLNRRLGIVGGISILGTTGIVVPFSTAAYTATISQALGIALAAGCREVVLTTGRRSDRFAQALLDNLPEEAFVQMGDFAGYALEECARRGFAHVTICAMVGKLSKIAAGHFQTHVSHSSISRSFLAGIAAECGADPALVEEIAGANTGRHFGEIARESGITVVFERLCQLAAEQCHSYVERRLAITCLLTDFDGGLLGRASVGR